MSTQFELPSDADPALNWEREDMHAPSALPLLSQDFIREVLDAINARFERFELPVRIEAVVVNGYTFVAERLLDGADPRSLKPIFDQKRDELIAAGISQWTDDALPTLQGYYSELAEMDLGGASSKQAATSWRKAWKRTYDAYKIHFALSTLFYGPVDQLADFFTEEVGGTEQDALRLIQGRTEMLNRSQADMFDLVQELKKHPQLVAAVEEGASSLGSLKGLGGYDSFAPRYREFVSAHGHLGQAFDDLSHPSWAQDPSLLFAELRKRTKAELEDPRKRQAALLKESEELANETRSRLDGEVAEKFERLLAAARTLGPLTEDHNYLLDRMFHHHMHDCALRAGERLVVDGVITKAVDVFHLSTEEIAGFLESPEPASELVAERKQELAAWLAMDPPQYLGAPPGNGGSDRFSRAMEPTDSSDGVLKGHAASTGTVTGLARVVLGPQDFASVSEGEIVVAPASNPSWVPLFGVIGGLVTNTGGVLCHAAVVAREFGIPAVVGVPEATTKIASGDKISVDGSTGEVHLL